MILSFLRRLRHGPLRSMGPFWVLCGNLFRALLGRTGLFISQDIGGYGPFKMDVRFAFSNFSVWGADRHNDGFAACIVACRDKRCVFDIGAHIGLVSLPMATVIAPGGTVVSFEPGEANRNLLKKHVQRNGFGDRIQIEDKLVGAADIQDVEFFEMDDASGMNSIVRTEKAGVYKSLLKQQISLDQYCAYHDLSPDVMKIDVEGAEIDVLNGASKTIQKSKPTIFLSVHPGHIARLGRSVAELVELIRSFEYQITHMDGSPVENFALREYILTPATHLSDKEECLK